MDLFMSPLNLKADPLTGSSNMLAWVYKIDFQAKAVFNVNNH
jgi:hypothetical protein